jgi:hypothetical protein
MKLPPDDVEIFYQIHASLLSFVNQRHQLFPGLDTAEELEDFANPEQIQELREVCYGNLDLLDDFIAANPDHLPAGHLEIARTWHHLKQDTFILFRYLKKYTIFLEDERPPKAYGVLGLRSDFDEIISMRPPVMVEAVLLPFRDKIIFDGLIQTYRIRLGGNIRRRLNGDYRHAKERFGIITSLLHDPTTDEETINASHERVLKAFRRWVRKQYGLRDATVERHVTNIQCFVDHHLRPSDPLRSLHEINPADIRAYFRDLPSETSVDDSRPSFKKFLRFMRDTGRMQYHAADDVYETVRAYE